MGMNLVLTNIHYTYNHISTHTPVWGWTHRGIFVASNVHHFNPHPPQGDELMENFEVVPTYLFQHTPPQGDEPDFFLHSRSLLFITTHTPAWGMNNFDQAQTVIFRNFNPHPRMGMNAILLNSIKPFLQFQPTSPHGDEQKAWVVNLKICTLQPTPPHGDERYNLIKNQLYRIFNSQPSMGMNETPVVNFHLMHNFNPHPRMGMNGTLQKTAVDSFVFQPTPPHGDEPVNSFILCFKPWHISTHIPAWGMNLLVCS